MTDSYDITDYPPFAVTVDLVVLAVRDNALQVLLVERGGEPFRGALALPGGFVKRGFDGSGENLGEAARRELEEETGLDLSAPYVGQIGAYGDAGRDPRGNVVTVAFLVVGAAVELARAGGDAAAVVWLPIERVADGTQPLAFDHAAIVSDALARTRELIENTALATAFCGPFFTIADLRRVYEIVWGLEPGSLDAGNFHKRVMSQPHFIAEVDPREAASSSAEDLGFRLYRSAAPTPARPSADAARLKITEPAALYSMSEPSPRPLAFDSAMDIDVLDLLQRKSSLSYADTAATTPMSSPGRPPRWFRLDPSVGELGPAARLERPITPPPGRAGR